MFKRLAAFMSGLYKSPVFRRSVAHFTVLAIFVGAFAYLTLNNDSNIVRTTSFEVPSQYKALPPMAAVDLEQALRSKSKDVEGLVFFKNIKSVVVLGRGFGNDNLVSSADTDIMEELAKASKLPTKVEDAGIHRETAPLFISAWWSIAIALSIWAAIFLFRGRGSKDDKEPSRFTVFWNGYCAALKGLIKATKLRRSRFYGLVTIVLIASVVGIFTTRVFNNNNMLVLPSELAAVERAEPYQVERHLRENAADFNRVAFAPSVGAAYIVLNTTPARAKVEAAPAETNAADVEVSPEVIGAGAASVYRGPHAAPAAVAKPKVRDGASSIARTVVYPDTPQGLKDYRAFVDSVRAQGIENKELPRAVASDFFDTIYTPARWLIIILACLAMLTLALTISAFFDSEKDDDQNESNLVIAGPDGKPAPVGNTTVQSLKKFEDVAGCDEAIEACKLVVKKLRFPMIYKVFGAPVPKGIIFYGAPGCGKTLLARAMAGETGGGFIAVSGSQFVKMYVGVGANAVREKFQEARDLAKKTGKPTFLFIDEFDAIGKKRGQGEGGGDKEYEQTLNELLVQMDGFANDGKVIVIAATNRLDVLDEAVLRSGRFDIKIEIKKPDRKGRAEIFQVYLRNRKLTAAGASPREQLQTLQKVLNDCSTRSRDFSGADIELTVKEASTIAAERHYEELKDMSEEEMKERAVLLPSDLQEAIDLVSYGRTLKSRTRSAQERKATAIHEIGHAAIPTLLKGDPVSRITIVMTDKSLGLMESGSDEDRYGWDKKEFILRIKTMLAGRAAEERIGGSCSTGASNDFERASMLARQMVGMFGMSEEFGVRTIPLDRNALPVGQIGNTLMETFTTAWSRIVDECQKEVCQLIDDNRERIIRAADVLFEEEVLSGDRFREIWNAPLHEKSVETNAEGNA
jgi:cell division protease FtsH